MVGATGFEPATFSSRTKRATRLRYAPRKGEKWGTALRLSTPSRCSLRLPKPRPCDFIFTMATARYLLVDAYNAIHADQALRAILPEGGDRARDALAERIRSIHDAEGVHTIVVLDGRGERAEVEHPYGANTFEFLYAPAALTADGAIERMVARGRNRAEMRVASQDRMIREAVRAMGAVALTIEELFEWARACDLRLQQDLQRRRKRQASEWRHGIDL